MLHQILGSQKISPILYQFVQNAPPGTVHEVIIETPFWRHDRVISIIESYRGEVSRTIKLIPAIEARIPAQALMQLAKTMFIRKLWSNTPVYALSSQIDIGSSFFGRRESGSTGKAVVVALLDTGIHPHADLMIPENRIIGWKDINQGRNCPYDDHGHGTYVARIIAGNGITSRGKYQGIAPEVKLVGIKVLNHNAVGNLTDLILGIEWCLKNQKDFGIRVINLSLGTRIQGAYYRDLLCRVTTLAWEKGLVVCAAAGNTPFDGHFVNSPGLNPRIITVGELEQQKELARDSNRSGRIKGIEVLNSMVIPDLVVSRSSLTPLKEVNRYSLFSCPSASAVTPCVTGGIALILQQRPYYSPKRIKRMLIKIADDSGLDSKFLGAGILNLDVIINKVSKDSNNRSLEIDPLVLRPDKTGVLKKLFDFINQVDIKMVNRVIRLIIDEIGQFPTEPWKAVLSILTRMDVPEVYQCLSPFLKNNNLFQERLRFWSSALNILKHLDLLKLGENLGNFLKDPESLQSLIKLMRIFRLQSGEPITNT